MEQRKLGATQVVAAARSGPSLSHAFQKGFAGLATHVRRERLTMSTAEPRISTSPRATVTESSVTLNR